MPSASETPSLSLPAEIAEGVADLVSCGSLELSADRAADVRVIASILLGMISAVGLILLSPDMFERYGLLRGDAPVPLSSCSLIASATDIPCSLGFELE